MHHPESDHIDLSQAPEWQWKGKARLENRNFTSPRGCIDVYIYIDYIYIIFISILAKTYPKTEPAKAFANMTEGHMQRNLWTIPIFGDDSRVIEKGAPKWSNTALPPRLCTRVWPLEQVLSGWSTQRANRKSLPETRGWHHSASKNEIHTVQVSNWSFRWHRKQRGGALHHAR